MVNKKVLIIGGTGFIGRHLVTEAIKRKYEVTTLSLNKPHDLDKSVKSICLDISSSASVKNAIGHEKFNYVIFAGGYINHSKYSKGGNLVIDEHLSSLYGLFLTLDCSELIKFLYLGSSDEYGQVRAPQKEIDRELAISPYSYAKVAAAHFLQMLWRTEKIPTVVVRLFLTYGPGQSHNRFLPQVIDSCLQNKDFDASGGEQYRDFLYISDTVRACFKLLDSDQVNGEIFNIASGKRVRIREVIDLIINIIGKGRPNYGKIAYRTGENMNLYADISKANEVINWFPSISLKDGLIKTVNYYKAQRGN